MTNQFAIAILRFYCNIDFHIDRNQKGIKKIAFSSANKKVIDCANKIISLQFENARLVFIKQIIDECRKFWSDEENLLFNYKFTKLMNKEEMLSYGYIITSRKYFRLQNKFIEHFRKQLNNRNIDEEYILINYSNFQEIQEYLKSAEINANKNRKKLKTV